MADKASIYGKTEIDALLAAQAPLFHAITPLKQNNKQRDWGDRALIIHSPDRFDKC